MGRVSYRRGWEMVRSLNRDGFYGGCEAAGVCQGLAGRCILESVRIQLWHAWGEQARAELRHNG